MMASCSTHGRVCAPGADPPKAGAGVIATLVRSVPVDHLFDVAHLRQVAPMVKSAATKSDRLPDQARARRRGGHKFGAGTIAIDTRRTHCGGRMARYT